MNTRRRPRTPVIGIAGWKKSGKTTLVVRLIEEFTRRGLKVATVKHAHHDFQIDDARDRQRPPPARRRRAGGRRLGQALGADRRARRRARARLGRGARLARALRSRHRRGLQVGRHPQDRGAPQRSLRAGRRSPTRTPTSSPSPPTMPRTGAAFRSSPSTTSPASPTSSPASIGLQPCRGCAHRRSADRCCGPSFSSIVACDAGVRARWRWPRARSHRCRPAAIPAAWPSRSSTTGIDYTLPQMAQAPGQGRRRRADRLGPGRQGPPTVRRRRKAALAADAAATARPGDAHASWPVRVDPRDPVSLAPRHRLRRADAGAHRRAAHVESGARKTGSHSARRPCTSRSFSSSSPAARGRDLEGPVYPAALRLCTMSWPSATARADADALGDRLPRRIAARR